MELTSTQQQALDAATSGKSVLITGRAGSGKSMWIQKFKECNPDRHVAVTATTGIAAISIGGTTINDFSGIGIPDNCGDRANGMFMDLEDQIHPDPEAEAAFVKQAVDYFFFRLRPVKWEYIEWTETLIIDECSMLSRYFFEMLDIMMRKVRHETRDQPFGGLQIILVGDMLQMPPVSVSRKSIKDQYLFESSVFNFDVFVFREIFRQDDLCFQELLNRVADGLVTPADIKVLRARVVPPPRDATRLFGRNDEVNVYNRARLAELPGEEYEYHRTCDVMEQTGGSPAEMDAFCQLATKNCIADEVIALKKGAYVMLTYNLSVKQGLANGTCGHIVDFQDGNPLFVPLKHEGEEPFLIRKAKWEITKYKLGTIVITQIPIRPAWAITIHKSQGQQLSRTVTCLNRRNCFSAGQAYVALSRQETLEGLYLEEFDPSCIKADPKAVAFFHSKCPS